MALKVLPKRGPLFSFKNTSGSVQCVTFNPAMTRLATLHDHGTLQLWDTASGENIMILQLEGEAADVPNRLAWSVDTKCRKRLWSASGQCLWVARPEDLTVLDIERGANQDSFHSVDDACPQRNGLT